MRGARAKAIRRMVVAEFGRPARRTIRSDDGLSWVPSEWRRLKKAWKTAQKLGLK